jgi:hypothetical protein
MELDPSSPDASPELPKVIPFNPPSSTDRPILLPTQVYSRRTIKETKCHRENYAIYEVFSVEI